MPCERYSRVAKWMRARFETLPYFCINDTCDDAQPNDARLRRIAHVLSELLPEPSRFESLVTGISRQRTGPAESEDQRLIPLTMPVAVP